MDAPDKPELGRSDFDAQISDLLRVQRDGFYAQSDTSVAVRKDRLQRALDGLLAHRQEFIDALSADFSHRSADTTLFADILAGAHALKHALKHIDGWMKKEKRPLRFPLGLLGAKAWIEPQPKGVVGLITPWNFPLTMVYVPLAQMLAAGNRVMIKPSEHTPRTSELLARVMQERFEDREVAVVLGGPEVSAAFARQPFDHLMYTGGTEVGKLVMRAASEHLVPVTLELGGKSPAIVGESADIEAAAERIATMKLLNAGQVCLAPDYVLVHTRQLDAFTGAYRAAVVRMYPTIGDNDDYTSMVNARHFDRMADYIAEARVAGAAIECLVPGEGEGEAETGGDESGARGRKVPPYMVVNPPRSLRIMREEIFGPILPILTFDDIDEAIRHVNGGDRPLALYHFGSDPVEEEKILTHTWSGGVTLNDCLYHGATETLPFGGIGASGMGCYHGYDGFKEFSHMKPVLKHPKTSVSRLMGLVPPYGEKLQKLLAKELG